MLRSLCSIKVPEIYFNDVESGERGQQWNILLSSVYTYVCSLPLIYEADLPVFKDINYFYATITYLNLELTMLLVY